MSLINDALRRASQQKPASAPPSHGGAPLQPVDYRGNPSPWRSLLLIPVLIILCGLSGWFFWSARKTTPTGPALKDALVSQAHPVLTPATQPSDRLIANAPEKKAQVAIQVNTNLVVRTNVLVQAPLPAALAPPLTLASAPPVLGGTVTENAITEQTKPVPADTRTTGSPAPFPKLKLQGIYFRRTNPSVLINGRTLFVGDRVDGARVVTVDRQTVTMEFSGQTNLLTL